MGAALEPAAPPADDPGLKLDHTVWCWGGTATAPATGVLTGMCLEAGALQPGLLTGPYLGTDGRIGTGTSTPIELPGGAIELAWPCARASDGSVWCWGGDPYHLGGWASADGPVRLLGP